MVFSLWDWVFGTAYMPGDGSVPHRLGFAGDDIFPDALWRRFLMLPRKRGS